MCIAELDQGGAGANGVRARPPPGRAAGRVPRGAGAREELAQQPVAARRHHRRRRSGVRRASLARTSVVRRHRIAIAYAQLCHLHSTPH